MDRDLCLCSTASCISFEFDNKITKVRVGVESQKYPQMEGFLIPLSYLFFDSGKMLIKSESWMK